MLSLDVTNTKARKLYLKIELNRIEKKYLLVNDYAMKIINISKSLASTGMTIEIEDKVEVCLYGLTLEYKQLRTSI